MDDLAGTLRTFIVTMNAKTCDGQGYVARDLADVIIGEHLFADVGVTEASAPDAEREIRAKVAAGLRRAADGRREYARTASKDADEQDRMEDAARAYESAAGIAEDPLGVLDLIPVHWWTPEEHASVTPQEKTTPRLS
jgi:hypothetical protein